eukprot:TRINITY_DN1058_c1_g1_i11.p1 TRINITY_DN1058_c1_g1~~TRINITY_DN1058_c1_g1_i11.p1  ORF type:complete len:903 (+),score=136.99 TRINITY_DN1058_c1_g1_i11:2748-5456(+)
MKNAREELLHHILQRVRFDLGEVPVAVVGDFNTDEERSPTLRRALQRDWVDAAEFCAKKRGQEPENTFVRSNCGTRIDRILLNNIAAQGLIHCGITEEVLGSDHRCLSLKLNIPAYRQLVMRYNIPQEIPKTKKAPPGTAVNLMDNSNFRKLIEEGKTTDAFSVISGIAEKYLLHNYGGPQRGMFVGRGNIRKPVLTELSARSSTQAGGAIPTRQMQLEKLKKKIGIAKERMHAQLEEGYHGPLPTETRNILKNISQLGAALKVEYCQIDATEGFDAIWENLDIAGDFVEGERSELIAHRKECQKKAYERSIRADFGDERKHITAWVKDSPEQKTEAVSTEEGVTANLREMDAVMRKAWSAIFCAREPKDEPQFETFRKKYANFIGEKPMPQSAIDADLLKEVIRKKPDKGACGVDGWRISELKRLPKPILSGFADLFNLVERTGQWPEQITTALVTLTPKGEGSAPLNHRPITVTSTIYRLWASARLKQVLGWQERWITPNQHGFRPKHSTTSALMELCTKLELALVEGEPLQGIALDFSKCFDMVPQRLSLDLMSAMGLAEPIRRALQGMYNQISRRFKFPIGVGDPFEATNGILQGCPLSVIIINALLSVMIKTMEAAGVDVVAYADDAYLLAKLRSILQAGIDGALEFCTLTDMKLNDTKTVAFGTARGFKSEVLGNRKESRKGVEVTVPYKTVKSLKALGVQLSMEAGTTWNAPSTKAFGSLDRLGNTNLAFETKAHFVSSSILPSCLYASPFSPPNKETIKKLTTRITVCLWGPHHRGRSPIAVNAVLLKGHQRPYLISGVPVPQNDIRGHGKGRTATKVAENSRTLRGRGGAKRSGWEPDEKMAAVHRMELEPIDGLQEHGMARKRTRLQGSCEEGPVRGPHEGKEHGTRTRGWG